MSLETWLAFVAASTVLLAIPGPTILLVVGYALGHGRRGLWSTVGGVTLGDFTAMTLSLAGLGVVLSTSAQLFTVLKLLGAGYLVYLGIRMWRDGAETTATPAGGSALSRRVMFRNAFVVTALNPKSIVFFVAFLPQFVSPAEAFLPQAIVLEATFLALAAANAAVYGWLAGNVRGVMRRPTLGRILNRAGGAVLIGAGVLTALARRPS